MRSLIAVIRALYGPGPIPLHRPVCWAAVP